MLIVDVCYINIHQSALATGKVLSVRGTEMNSVRGLRNLDSQLQRLPCLRLWLKGQADSLKFSLVIFLAEMRINFF